MLHQKETKGGGEEGSREKEEEEEIRKKKKEREEREKRTKLPMPGLEPGWLVKTSYPNHLDYMGGQ